MSWKLAWASHPRKSEMAVIEFQQRQLKPRALAPHQLELELGGSALGFIHTDGVHGALLERVVTSFRGGVVVDFRHSPRFDYVGTSVLRIYELMHRNRVAYLRLPLPLHALENSFLRHELRVLADEAAIAICKSCDQLPAQMLVLLHTEDQSRVFGQYFEAALERVTRHGWNRADIT